VSVSTKATNTKTLHDLFMSQLADMYDAELRIVKALPKMAETATCNHLKDALLFHLKETESHVTKLEQVFELFGEEARGQKCPATVGLLAEGADLAVEFGGSPAINAALIAAAQKVEHYETATYGCLCEWAELLGQVEAAALLEGILDEEKAANENLTELAETRSNVEAIGQEATT
jgi:ferritin-like metal-binding protein YciE